MTATSILFDGACEDCGLVGGHLEDCTRHRHVCTRRTLRLDGVWITGTIVLASVTCRICHSSSVIQVAGPLRRKLIAAHDPELALRMEGSHG